MQLPKIWVRESVYRALGSDYHNYCGYCLTVSAAGWLQGSGLSAMSRKYGIGIDNVLSFEVVLANGIFAYADACTNSDLFWALRGGGGETWGVVTSVHFKLHPVEPVLEFTMSITNVLSSLSIVNSWIKNWPNLDRRWAGFFLSNFLLLYFVGLEKDARSTFIDDFEHWRECLPKSQKNDVVYSFKQGKSYFDVRSGEENIETLDTGLRPYSIASRLVPRDFVVNNPRKAARMLERLMMDTAVSALNYFLGGAVNDPEADATAVHPAMRKAVWQIHTFTDKFRDYVRKVVKDTGAGYNHASHVELDWRNAFWGSNLKRLQSLKKQYDPENRFNCWHCISYQGKEFD